MKILAIETSCDDTGVAILEVKNGKFNVLANVIASQVEVGQKYGGVFPAMAKREHQKNILPTFITALKESELLNNTKALIKLSRDNLGAFDKIFEREQYLKEKIIPFLQKYEKPKVDLISVTNGPGLEPCLWVGINFAKAISIAWNIPIVPVNHIESHILVNFIDNKKSYTLKPHGVIQCKSFPAVALVVSGGHTQIILVKKPFGAAQGKSANYKILGETRDDAAGECFDKCAKILGLGYPGGPAIAKLASQWKFEIRNSKFEIKLPRPMMLTKDYDFSFSGLKTAVLYSWQKILATHKIDGRQLYEQTRIQMAAEIQQAVIDVLIKKTMKAIFDFNAKSLILGGGVSANQELRKQFARHCEQQRSNLNLFFPEPNLSTDNAVMTAITGFYHKKNTVAWKKISADGNLRVGK